MKTLQGKEVVSLADCILDLINHDKIVGYKEILYEIKRITEFYNAPFQIGEVVRGDPPEKFSVHDHKNVIIKKLKKLENWQSIFKVEGEFFLSDNKKEIWYIGTGKPFGVGKISDFKTRSQFIDKCISLKIKLIWR